MDLKNWTKIRLKNFFRLPSLIWVILLLAFLLRIAWLNQNLFFGYEQGRDLLAIKDIIVNKNLTLLGPKTDIDGIFHGPLSFYLLIPSFLLTGGSPLLITVSLILVHILSFILLYKTNLELFGKKVATISVLLLAVSYSSIVYSRWLSNPNLIPALSIGIYYFLVRAREKPIFLILSASLWAVIFHLSLLSATTLIAPILLTVFVLKIKLTPKCVVLSTLACGLLLSSYPVFEFRNNFLLTNSVKHLWQTGDNKSLNPRNIQEFKNEIVDGVLPVAKTVALWLFALMAGISLLKSLKNKNYLPPLAFAFFPALFFLLSGISPARHAYIETAPFISVVLACGVAVLLEKKRALGLLILAVVVAGNLWSYKERIPVNKGNFLQNAQSTYLGPELKMLDFAYKDAAGASFNYEYYSIPYWKNEGWRYLFEWYGNKKYGYLPQERESKVFYLFIEPDLSQKLYQKNWYEEVNSKSRLIESHNFDRLIVEKRERKP